MKFDMRFKNIQFKYQIFKIRNYVNLLSESYSFKLQLSLQSNFVLKIVPLNNILSPYKQKEKSKKIFI